MIKKEIFNNHVGMSYKEMQPEWGQLFEKVLKYVDQSRVMTAFTPSKLLGMVAVVTQNTEKPGVPCKLNQKEISKILHLPEEGVGKTLKKLEEIGVIKRVRGQGRNYITPILPDKVSDETATVDCCDAPKEISK